MIERKLQIIIIINVIDKFPVGSLAFEKIVQENRSLRREREVLTQKLGKSKSALQVLIYYILLSGQLTRCLYAGDFAEAVQEQHAETGPGWLAQSQPERTDPKSESRRRRRRTECHSRERTELQQLLRSKTQTIYLQWSQVLATDPRNVEFYCNRFINGK